LETFALSDVALVENSPPPAGKACRGLNDAGVIAR
jgi:hypothetical protein